MTFYQNNIMNTMENLSLYFKLCSSNDSLESKAKGLDLYKIDTYPKENSEDNFRRYM